VREAFAGCTSSSQLLPYLTVTAVPSTLLVFGSRGQLGWELVRSLTAVGWVAALGRAEVDFRRPGATPVHFSTDYAFDGRKEGVYVETDVPNPLNAYGRTKLASEMAVRQSGGSHLILRTS